MVGDETAFLVDFLPVIRRTLTRTGFVIDHVHYFSDALKPWIARRGRTGGAVAAAPAASPPPDDIPADGTSSGRAADAGPARPFEVIEQW